MILQSIDVMIYGMSIPNMALEIAGLTHWISILNNHMIILTIDIQMILI